MPHNTPAATTAMDPIIFRSIVCIIDTLDNTPFLKSTSALLLE